MLPLFIQLWHKELGILTAEVRVSLARMSPAMAGAAQGGLLLSPVPLPTSALSLVLQIPRYILTLHELLAHTPHEHVERNSLDYAKSKLEELSR